MYVSATSHAAVSFTSPPVWITVKCYYCRIDAHFVIKITDFGLSEDVYARNYFRQGQGSSVKLPVKWMAPESLQDGVFSDKTDVVSVQLS